MFFFDLLLLWMLQLSIRLGKKSVSICRHYILRDSYKPNCVGFQSLPESMIGPTGLRPWDEGLFGEILGSSFGGWVEALLEMSSCKDISTKWFVLIEYNLYMHVELAWKLNGVIFQGEVQIKLWPKTPRYQLPKSKTLKLHKGPGQRYIDNHRNYSQCKRHLGKCCQNTLYSSNIDHLLRKVHCLLPILYSNFCRLQNGTSKTTQSDSINPRISGEKNSHDCKYKKVQKDHISSHVSDKQDQGDIWFELSWLNDSRRYWSHVS